MAKKRVNYKFLLLLGVPVLLLGGLAVAYETVPQLKWLIRGTPKSHVAQADALYAAGKFANAAGEYKRAIQLNGGSGDAAWFLAIANCYEQIVLDEPRVNLGQMNAFTEKAVGTDPNYEPALRKQLKLAIDFAEQARGQTVAASWSHVAETADALIRALPGDRDGLIAKNHAIIQQYLSSGRGSSDALEKSSAALVELANKNPFNADALSYALTAKLGQVANQQRQSDRDGAAKTAGETLKILESALAAHPDDAVLHFRAAGFLGPLMGSLPQPDATKIGTRILTEAETGSRLIKPEDRHFDDAKLIYARALQASGKLDAATAVYDELVKTHPADVAVRLIYADFLGNLPGRAADALKLLSDVPAHAPGELTGVPAAASKSLDFAVLSEQLTLQFQILPTVPKENAEKMLTTMEEEFARFTINGDQSAQAMYLRGQLELARNKDVDAVQTFNRGLTMASGNEQQDIRLRLTYALAQANLKTRQSGRAKELLYQIVNDVPSFLPAKLLLAQTLIAEHTPASLAAARTQIDAMDKVMPNNPEISRMRVGTFDKNIPADRAALEKTLADLPEDKPSNIIDKSRLAQFLGHPDQAIALLIDLSKRPDAPAETAAALAQAYAVNNQKDQALATIDAALSKNEDQPGLKILRAQLSGGDVAALSKSIAEKLSDPFARETALYQLASNQGDAGAMLTHLDAAEKLKPDDGHVKDLQFQLALRRGDLDRASQLVDWLTKHNQDQANGLIFKTRLAMAQAAVKQGDEQIRGVRAALESAQQLTRQLPEFAESWVVLGQVQMTLQNFSEAQQSFSTALARQNSNADALIGQIDAVDAQGRADAEVPLLADAEVRLPGDTRVLEQRLRYELNHGDPEKAIAPRGAQLQAALSRPGGDSLRAYFQLAQAYLMTAARRDGEAARGFYEKALATSNDGLKVDPKNYSLVAIVAESCLKLKRPNDGSAAILKLQEAIDPKKDANPTLMLAEFYGRSGNAAAQEKTLRDLLNVAPETLKARLTLTSNLAAANRLDEALLLLPIDPPQPDILKQRIELLTNAGRYAEADKEIAAQLAKTTDPSSTLLDQQARVMAATGHDAQALKVIDQVLAKNANDVDVDALYYRAKIHLARADNVHQAITDLREVVRRTNNFEVRMALASALSNSGDSSAAIQVANETIALRPAAREPRLMLAALYSQQAPPRWPQAEAAINDAMKEPTLAHDPVVLNSAAQLWLNANHRDADKALQLITDALSVVPNEPTLVQTKLQALLAARKPRDVLSETQPLLELKQPPTWVYNYRGQAHTALDDKQAALDDYSAGISAAMALKQSSVVSAMVNQISKDIGIGPAKTRITPLAEKGDPQWQLIMSNLCQVDHDLPGATKWAERILANESSLAPDILYAARAQAGQLYLVSEPPEAAKAVDVYNKILEHDPGDLNALNNLANTMILPNSGVAPGEALKIAHRAADAVNGGGAAVSGFRPYVFDTLGWIQVLSGDPSGAIPNLRESLEAHPLADTCYHLGEAYLALKPPQPDQALNALKQAQDLLKNSGSSTDSDLPGKVVAAITRTRQVTTAPAAQK